MTEKLLGKISSAEYGSIRDMPFLFGLQLGFSMSNCAIMDGGMHTFNISKDCRWEHSERSDVIVASVEKVNEILKAAKVNYVSELKNKPVEVTIESNTFKDFRILTEVL